MMTGNRGNTANQSHCFDKMAHNLRLPLIWVKTALFLALYHSGPTYFEFPAARIQSGYDITWYHL